MTTDEHVIAQLAEANPVPAPASPTAQERAEAERVLRHVLDDARAAPPRRRHPRLGVLVPVASLLVVLVVAAVVLRTGGSATTTGSAPSGGLSITLRAEPTPQTPRITAGAMSRELAIIRARLRTVGRGLTVTQSGASGIVVTVPKARAAERARIVRLVSQRAQLSFYDWEANVLTPNGRTAASQLRAQDPTAIGISEGNRLGPGTPGGGSLSLYEAATLAAKQPPRPRATSQSRAGPSYYFFGAPGSAACTEAAKTNGTIPVQGQHCLLSGPDSSLNDLYSGLPAGLTKSDGELVTVPQGMVVLQAVNSSASAAIRPDGPAAQFYVLEDNVALTGDAITNPQPGTDQTGAPDVTFAFTPAGQRRFEQVTRQLARRGANVSVGGNPVNQHFAVALDDRLITVPQIDYRQYPAGITAGGGADVTGGFTPQSARDLATELRLGALPLAVRVLP